MSTMSVPTISPEGLHERMQGGERVRLIDVRTPGEYRGEHVPGAESMPLDRLDAEALKRSNGTPVFLLCRSGKRASAAHEQLAASGLTGLHVVEGGLEAWEKAGLPVERGKGVISLERQVRIGAGALVLLGVLLGWLVHPAFFGLSAFVGVGLMFAGITDWCGMAMVLAKMPWNRGDGCGDRC